ncbi:MAG: glycine zipper 2TM domain-containing protein [Candidatus Hydrogenedentes bacterium]|nr:glycine zipper 2TM domain-containing protein [Candidatus Hydrogenedentota bacterium]
MKKLLAMAVVVSVGSTFFLMGCQTTPTQQGAVAGGLLGAGAGAIIGNQVHGKSGEGALIGAAAGALTGALIGDHVDERRDRRGAQQQRAQQAPPPASAPTTQNGHWETHTVTTASGETYEERVFVQDR